MSDLYLVIDVTTTCDEHGVYVSKDSAEVIEMAWRLLDASTLHEIARDSVLNRPTNTPITALCTNLTTLTWEHVRNSGNFKDAISKLDAFVHEYIISKNLEFTFVTWDAWDLRVQLPREARDKTVVLPPYLQHARVFDIKDEYAKWQAHHPEALSYSASNLSSILTALEVELDPSNTSFQVHPQQLQSQSQQPHHNHHHQGTQQEGRRAGEEVEIVTSILKALVKKCTPAQDHHDVLTHPYDARADVRAFLAERSKVLYMTNLPYDTTQSELESWFTQYGGRPIAFWTLKTPDQNKPTGSGFAVFSSHEEAAESLAMNGRSLNDKCIQVQPSSARVLDRAQEILTLFPPSKNRPRPGDWTCPSCGFSNFQRRTACFRCSFPASSAAAVQESIYTANGNGSQGSANTNNNGNGNNNSNNNNNNNNNSHNHGHAHSNNHTNNNHNHGHAHNHTHNSNGHNHSNNNNNNNNNNGNGNNNNNNNNNNHGGNNHNNGHGQRFSSVPFRAGDWKCGNDGCAYHNFAKNICCLRCGAPRVQQVQGQSAAGQGSSGQLTGQQGQPRAQAQDQQQSARYFQQVYNTDMKDLSKNLSGINIGYAVNNSENW